MTVAPTDRSDAASALAKRRENGNVATNTLADQIRKMERDFQLAMPRGAEAKQLIRDALTALRTIKHLDKCEATSVLGALMTCAQLGLRPGVLGHAWPLPFWDNRSRGYKAQLVIGYQGYIELAHRSGKVSSLIARTVYASDTFDVDYGLADSLVHKPNLFEDRGDPIAYYAIAKFTSGGHAFLVMTQKELFRHRDRYAPRNREGNLFGPWVDNFEGQALKTTIRQLFKYLPKSTEMATAMAADEGVRVDLSPTVDAAETTERLDVLDGEVVADTDTPVVAPVSGPPDGNGRPALPKQKKDINELAGQVGAEGDALPAYLSDLIGRDVSSVDELTNREAAQALARMRAYVAQQEPPGGGS